MTPSVYHQPCACRAIPDLLERLRAAGESASWDDFRQEIRHLMRDRSLAPSERIQLLEIYDELVTTVERRCAAEPEALAKVGYQRAVDCMVFTLSETVFFDGDRDPGAFNRTLHRERVLGRFRQDDHVRQAASDIVAALSTADRGDR
jgi:hypothetical protein